MDMDNKVIQYYKNIIGEDNNDDLYDVCFLTDKLIESHQHQSSFTIDYTTYWGKRLYDIYTSLKQHISNYISQYNLSIKENNQIYTEGYLFLILV